MQNSTNDEGTTVIPSVITLGIAGGSGGGKVSEQLLIPLLPIGSW